MINRAEMIKNMMNYQNRAKKPLLVSTRDVVFFGKIMSVYFDYMWDAVLKGKVWHIHDHHYHGEFYIQVTETKQMKPTPQYYKDEELRLNKHVLNPNTIGKTYKIVWDNKTAKKYKARFRAPLSVRKRLNHILRTEGAINVN